MANGERLLRVRAALHDLGQSLFFVPALLVAGSVLLAQAVLEVDAAIDDDSLPGIFVTTVDSARSVLSTIAGATITAASVVLSLTLVAVQLASSQFSPRSLGNYLGDRFQQVVIGLVLGTFTYSMLVLREVRGPIETDGEPVVPGLAVAVAVLAALVALVSLIASINRTAQSLRVASVLDRIVRETRVAVENRFTEETEGGATGAANGSPTTAADVVAPRSGWVQQLSFDALLDSVPEGSTVHLATTTGRHLLEGSTIARVEPVPDDPDAVRSGVLRSLVIGDRRTLQHDVDFGLLQLEDVALRALSPGVNDPNTAVDVVHRMGAVLLEILARPEPERVLRRRGRTLVRPVEPGHRDHLGAALDGIHRHAHSEPTVLAAIGVMLGDLAEALRRRRPGADLSVLVDYCARIRASADELAPDDRQLVMDALDSDSLFGDI